jgi:chromosomal replication initiation ATPase DnaA
LIRQLALPFPHAPDFSRAIFLAAPSNREALTWLERDADWPQRRVALWGEAGSGKSHLLHRWAARRRGTLLAGASLRLGAMPPSGPVALDDADLAPERPLLHLLNAAAEAGLPVLLAGRQPPSRWNTALPDLASRLRATLAVRIRPAGDELLRQLLAALFTGRQLPVPEPVQDFLLRHLPRNAATMREAAARLDRLALATGGRVTRALAAQVVAELAEIDDNTMSIDEDLACSRPPASPQAPGFL